MKHYFVDSFSSSTIGDGEASSGSDDTAIVIRNPSEKRDAEDRRLGRVRSIDCLCPFCNFVATIYMLLLICVLCVFSVYCQLSITSPKMIEDILKSSPGGDKITHEYARTKTLSDVRRRDLVKILVAHLTN